MTDDDDITRVPVEIPTGALAASASSPSGWCLTLSRDETVALLRASPRWRSVNPLLGRAAMRSASNDRYGHGAEIPHRIAREQEVDTETFSIPSGREISRLSFSHDGKNLNVEVRTRPRPRTINHACQRARDSQAR